MRKIVKREQTKVDDRYLSSKDNMIMPVSKPGSDERIEALRLHYATTLEQSPFGE